MGQELTAVYDLSVAEGLLRHDPLQREVMARLEPTRAALDTVTEPKGFYDRFRKAETPESSSCRYSPDVASPPCD